jgi:hypothetical protein
MGSLEDALAHVYIRTYATDFSSETVIELVSVLFREMECSRLVIECKEHVAALEHTLQRNGWVVTTTPGRDGFTIVCVWTTAHSHLGTRYLFTWWGNKEKTTQVSIVEHPDHYTISMFPPLQNMNGNEWFLVTMRHENSGAILFENGFKGEIRYLSTTPFPPETIYVPGIRVDKQQVPMMKNCIQE